jgi:VanZ family protein
MNRPVLLGGRAPIESKTFVSWLLAVWSPVVIMLIAILIESTSKFSANNTSTWMRTAFQVIFGWVSDLYWPTVHHYVRKTGHFTGYGLLGLAWLRGWLLFWLMPLRHRAAGVWRAYCVVLALSCTALIATLDELHQSFLPDRTGMVADVGLDTFGAAVIMLLVATFWIRRPWQPRTH